jgi:hypothetical protein
MAEDDPAQLMHAVQSQHGGKPVWIAAEPVKEMFDGKDRLGRHRPCLRSEEYSV